MWGIETTLGTTLGSYKPTVPVQLIFCFFQLMKTLVTLMTRFMGPTWGPPGPMLGPMLAPWTLLSGLLNITFLFDWCRPELSYPDMNVVKKSNMYSPSRGINERSFINPSLSQNAADVMPAYCFRTVFVYGSKHLLQRWPFWTWITPTMHMDRV